MTYIETGPHLPFLSKRLIRLPKMQGKHVLISACYCMMRLSESLLFLFPLDVPQLGRNDTAGVARCCVLAARSLVVWLWMNPDVIRTSLLAYHKGALYTELSFHYSSGVLLGYLDRVTVAQGIPETHIQSLSIDAHKSMFLLIIRPIVGQSQ